MRWPEAVQHRLLRLLRPFASARLLAWGRAIRRVRADYRQGHGANPALLRPRSFNEKVQWRKLFDLDPRLAVLTDKLAVRAFIEARVGRTHLVPLLWQGERAEDVPLEALPRPFVLKPNHSSGPHRIVEQADRPDWAAVRAVAGAWLAHCHGSAMVEPANVHIPRRLMVERRLLTPAGEHPAEYRVFTFGGRVTLIQNTLRNAAGEVRTASFHDRAWHRVPLWLLSPPREGPFPVPPRLAEVVALAERLGRGLSHIRVDIYDCGNALFVGELTPYPFSGGQPFHPPELGIWLGDQWRLRFPALRAIWAVAFRRHEIRPPRRRLRRLAWRLAPARLRDWAQAIRQVRADFLCLHERHPALLRPRGFTEKMQWRKLFDLDPRLAVLSDKLAARCYIAERVGADCLPELLWSGARAADIPLDTLARPFVLKSSHGCGQVRMIEPGEAIDEAAVRRETTGWLAHCHDTQHCEPGYVNVPRRLLAERRLITPEGGRPQEYCIAVCQGRVALLQVRLARADGERTSSAFYDRNWRRIAMRVLHPDDPRPQPRPARLTEMIWLAETLGAGFGFVRIDLYDCGDALKLGELTPYAWSGTIPFQPPEVGLWLGGLWRIRFPALRAAWAVAFRRHEIRPPPAPRTSAVGVIGSVRQSDRIGAA